MAGQVHTANTSVSQAAQGLRDDALMAACGLVEAKRFAAGWVTWLVMAATWGGVRPFRVTARKPVA